MLDRLLVAIIKELILFLRDPRARAVLFGVPVMQVIIFGFAATLEVRNVELAIINDDAGYWSQELSSRISSASFVKRAVRLDSADELASMIERREVLLGLHFPADFSRDVIAGESAKLQMIVDGRRANAGQIAASYIASITAGLGVELIEAASGGVTPPRAEVRYWFNPNLNYKWFIVPGLAATMSMVIALMVTTLSISRERELGTFDQLLVSPSTPLEIIISKTVPGVLAAGFVGCAIVAIAILGFGVPFRGSLLVLLGCMLPYVLSLVGVGLVISSIAKTQQQAVLGLFFCMVPFILISGFATPVENMPLWLQYCAEASPLKHYLIIVHGSFLKSMPLEDVMQHVWPLLTIAAVTLSTATIVVRRRLQ